MTETNHYHDALWELANVMARASGESPYTIYAELVDYGIDRREAAKHE